MTSVRFFLAVSRVNIRSNGVLHFIDKFLSNEKISSFIKKKNTVNSLSAKFAQQVEVIS